MPSRTIKITPKVALRTSEVLLSIKMLSKILILFYTLSLFSLLLIHLNLLE